MSKVTILGKASVNLIATSRAKAIELAQAAQTAIKDARIAELEFKNTIQQVYIENGLDNKCNISLETGQVTWPEEEPAEAAEETVPEASEETAAE